MARRRVARDIKAYTLANFPQHAGAPSSCTTHNETSRICEEKLAKKP